MTAPEDFFKSWMRNWNSFSTEKNQFEEDVHILILGTLHAGVTYLNDEADRENAKLEPHIKNASPETLERTGSCKPTYTAIFPVRSASCETWRLSRS